MLTNFLPNLYRILCPKYQDLGFSDASLTAHEIALAEVGAIAIAAACEAVLARAPGGAVNAVRSAVPPNVAAWEWWRGSIMGEIYTGWWFQIFFIFTPKIGEGSHFDEHIFQRGWNHQLVYLDFPLFVDLIQGNKF